MSAAALAQRANSPTGRPEDAASVLVVGVGNEALGDEGVGVRVARALAARDLPRGLRVLEGGTKGWALLGRLEGLRRLVLVDAMSMGRPPGTVVVARLDQLRRVAPPERTSLHGVAILDVLELASALGISPPEVYVVGIQPARIAPGFVLSPEVERALPAAAEAAWKAACGDWEQPAGPGGIAADARMFAEGVRYGQAKADTDR